MKKQRKWICFSVFLAVCCILLPKAAAYAKEQWIPFTEGNHEMTITIGDTGKFEIPEVVTIDEIQRKVYNTKIETVDYGSDYDWYDYDTYYNTDEEENTSGVLKVDKEGNFFAVAHGKVEVTITLYIEESEEEEMGSYNGYYSPYFDTLQSTYIVTVIPDMEKVTLKNSSQTKYVEKSIWGYYDIPSYTFSLNSDIILNGSNPGIDVTFSSSNSKIKVSGELYENNIILYPSDKGSTTVTITICGKTFKVTIKTIAVGINKNSLLIAKGKSSKLKVSGVSGGIKWSSSNKKIVTVSSNGTIKGKKTGNAVIKAKVGNISLGCAVSVVTDKRLKVVKHAIKIAKTCTYSQPKRMQNKYYDCSSLVWKAYSKYEQNFGSKSYAPVAADLGKWCANRKKLVKGGVTYNNVQKMKFNPGDLYFVTGSNNGRYKGISHVEMISGYVCYGFDSNGKPILELDYVNRYPGKYYGGMVGQP
ncbi:MAG: Ig-like domain-containing protein [Clostridiales bacterium]|nr:Ig-like domain-containing protein [Clostridiales bacterium]